jgi:hypothetical protein
MNCVAEELLEEIQDLGIKAEGDGHAMNFIFYC